MCASLGGQPRRGAWLSPIQRRRAARSLLLGDRPWRPPRAAPQHAHTALGSLSLLVKRALSGADAGAEAEGGGAFPLEELPLDLDGEHPVADVEPLASGGADMRLAGGRGGAAPGPGAGPRAGRGAAEQGRAAGARASLSRLLRLLRRLGDLAGAAALLLHVLDDAHGHRLPHVAHREAACGERPVSDGPARWSGCTAQAHESPQHPAARTHGLSAPGAAAVARQPCLRCVSISHWGRAGSFSWDVASLAVSLW